MSHYIISVSSFSTHSPDIVRSVLACSTTRKVVLPAVLPTHPGAGIRLTSPSQFGLSLVPDEFFTRSVVNIPLYSENGVRFSATIYLKETTLPNVCIYEFTTDHLQNKAIVYHDIKQLIAELIPVFEVDHALVYSEELSRKTKRSYFRALDNRYPRELGWFTYFGPELADFLRRRRFERLRSVAEKYDLHHGVMIILQQEPPLDEPSHLARQAQAEAELGLHSLK
jgi:hypothetical protein